MTDALPQWVFMLALLLGLRSPEVLAITLGLPIGVWLWRRGARLAAFGVLSACALTAFALLLMAVHIGTIEFITDDLGWERQDVAVGFFGLRLMVLAPAQALFVVGVFADREISPAKGDEPA